MDVTARGRQPFDTACTKCARITVNSASSRRRLVVSGRRIESAEPDLWVNINTFLSIQDVTQKLLDV